MVASGTWLLSLGCSDSDEHVVHAALTKPVMSREHTNQRVIEFCVEEGEEV
jgi:hypothetical protein